MGLRPPPSFRCQPGGPLGCGYFAKGSAWLKIFRRRCGPKRARFFLRNRCRPETLDRRRSQMKRSHAASASAPGRPLHGATCRARDGCPSLSQLGVGTCRTHPCYLLLVGMPAPMNLAGAGRLAPGPTLSPPTDGLGPATLVNSATCPAASGPMPQPWRAPMPLPKCATGGGGGSHAPPPTSGCSPEFGERQARRRTCSAGG